MSEDFNPTESNQVNQSTTHETEVKTSFLDSFSDNDLKNNSSLKDFKDVESLAKSYVNAQKLIGADKIILPKDDSPEAWGEVYNKLGRPETPDAYEIKIPEQIKEGMYFDNELITDFKSKSHELGLSKKQAEALYSWHVEKMEGKAEAFNALFNQQQEKVVEDLKKTWGNNYEKEVEKAKLLVDKVSTPDFKEYLDNTGLGNDINLIKFMNRLSKFISEDSFEGSDGTTQSNFTSTPEQARNQIKEIRSKKENQEVLMNKLHPSYKELNNKLMNLYKIAYPENNE